MGFRFLGTLLALVTLYLLTERLPRFPLPRTQRSVNTVLAVFLLLAVSTVYSDPLRQLVASKHGYARIYNVYHYYLGAKYFPELRYVHLYSCSLAADPSEGTEWPPDIPVRDLTTYRIVPRSELPGCPVKAFTDARWKEFRQDLRVLMDWQAADPQFVNLWQDAVLDKGFNQTPFWVFGARILTWAVDLKDDPATRILFQLDAVLFTLSLLLVARAFGTRPALLIGIAAVSYFGSYQRLLGNLLQYTWLALLLFAISLFRMKRDRISAACFSLAALLHGFPLLLLSGLAARTLLRWLASGRRETPRRAFTYLALVAAMTVLLAALCTPFVGVNSWLLFYDDISLHSRELVAEPFNIGLKNLVATAGSESLFQDHPYSYSKNHAETRIALSYFEGHYGVYVLLAVFGFGLFLLSVCWARSDVDTFPLSLLFLYLFFTLSPYYYLSLVLIFLLPAKKSSVAWVSQIGLLLLFSYHMRAPFLPFYVSFRYGAHWPSEILLAVFLVGTSAAYAIESFRRSGPGTDGPPQPPVPSPPGASGQMPISL